MKEEKKWNYDFYAQRNSIFENKEEIGIEKWEREELEQLREQKNNAIIENWNYPQCEWKK